MKGGRKEEKLLLEKEAEWSWDSTPSKGGGERRDFDIWKGKERTFGEVMSGAGTQRRGNGGGV